MAVSLLLLLLLLCICVPLFLLVFLLGPSTSRRRTMDKQSSNNSSQQQQQQSQREEDEARRREGERAAQQRRAAEVGAAPEERRLRELVAEFEGSAAAPRWDVLLAVGDIYRRGAYPRFLPNENLGAACFRLAAACPDGRVAGLGQTKFVEARVEQISAVDRAGRAMPTAYGERVCRLARLAIDATPWHAFERPAAAALRRDAQKEEEGTRHAADDDEDELLQELLLQDVLQLQQQQRQQRPRAAATTTDAQNVHDHGVASATRHNLRGLLQACGDDRRQLDAARETAIRDAIGRLDGLSASDRSDALHVIGKLTGDTHSALGASERGALSAVWHAIEATDSAELRANLTETLAKQLASAVEHGSVVCSTGKIARIVGTLEGTGGVSARPMWAVRDELASLAAQARDEAEGHQAANGAEAFARRAREEYVDKLGLSAAVIEPIIAEFVEFGFGGA